MSLDCRRVVQYHVQFGMLRKSLPRVEVCPLHAVHWQRKRSRAWLPRTGPRRAHTGERVLIATPPTADSKNLKIWPTPPPLPPLLRPPCPDHSTRDISDAVAPAPADGRRSRRAGVDEPEAQKLDEKEGDEVIDGTSQNDALHSVTIDKFDSPQLALPPSLLKGLYEMNFVRPSRIQAISLPKIWAGRNLLAQSHNGTGKTACFVLGMLRAVTSEPKPQALCLCPTRELAKQIAQETEKMGKHHLTAAGLAIKTILREERYDKGDKMKEQIVIGTPGKIWTLIGMRVLETTSIGVFVLDEADEMLMLGGLGDMTKRIRSKLPKQVQTLFFSATWTETVTKFAKTLGGLSANDWQTVTVKRKYIFNDQVRQLYYRCEGKKAKEERSATSSPRCPSASASSSCTRARRWRRSRACSRRMATRSRRCTAAWRRRTVIRCSLTSTRARRAS